MVQFPKRVTLELTNRCNFNCVFCPRKYMEKARGDVDLKLAFTLLEEMAEHPGVAFVPFFRGESLLHPHWDAILERAKSLGVGPIQMATNASLLTRDRADRMLGIDIDVLSFSMDTVNPETYARLRGGQYGESLDNIMYFLERRERSSSATRVQVSAVETAANKKEMEDFVAFWQPRADRVRIYAEHSSDGSPGSLTDPPFPRSERRPCHKVSEDIVIYWNGDVALCNHDWTRMVTGDRIGNVKEKGIGAVWNGEAYEAIRQAHAAGMLEGIWPCDECDHWATSYTPEGYWGRSYEHAPVAEQTRH